MTTERETTELMQECVEIVDLDELEIAMNCACMLGDDLPWPGGSTHAFTSSKSSALSVSP